jgi:hypothetical protein
LDQDLPAGIEQLGILIGEIAHSELRPDGDNHVRGTNFCIGQRRSEIAALSSSAKAQLWTSLTALSSDAPWYDYFASSRRSLLTSAGTALK